MPTTVAVVARDAHAVRPRSKILAILNDPDFIAVTIFALLGLVVAIGFAFFLPLSADLAPLLAQSS